MNHLQLSFENVKFQHQKKQSKKSDFINRAFDTRQIPIKSYAHHFFEETPPDNDKILALIQRCQEKIAEKGLFGESYILEYLNDQRRRCCRPRFARRIRASHPVRRVGGRGRPAGRRGR